MNCKQGDLAFVISAVLTPELLGAVVRCVRPAVDGEVFENKVQLKDTEFCWVVEGSSKLPWITDDGEKNYFKQRPIHDSALKPIRDTDGEDEMIRIAGKPQKLLKDKLNKVKERTK